MATGWLTASAADVPLGDDWLGPREREVLAGLRVEKRRADWRLGRWTAKRAVAAVCGVSADGLEILAAPDGAPDAWRAGARLAVSVSLSHRDGRAIAAVAPAPAVVGCDLERVEPRSPAFVREWLPAREQALLARLEGSEHARLANLLWCAREAAAKVRREGLRLDVRRAAVELDGVPGGSGPEPSCGWRPLRVLWDDAEPTAGWWREDPGWMMAVAAASSLDAPHRLDA
ncbi:MAG TPA: 4'-phosphopantetheinyl transferase superfamily protein [Solirubrobacteraceae bacterium]|nr:4'-phosphopantetheinyl transferase superfamily protein [Solirubrobacteraceae bacterium]